MKHSRNFFLSMFLGSLFSVFVQGQDTYYPLEIGYQWTYQMNWGEHTETIISKTRIGGIDYYGLDRWSSGYAEDLLREADNIVYILDPSDNTEYVLFNFNAEIGQSWDLPAGQFGCEYGTKITLVNKNDTLTTPMGTFTPCIHFQHVPHCMDAGILDIWFLLNVGKIRYDEVTIAGLNEHVLKDYSLKTGGLSERKPFPETFRLYQNYPNPFNAGTIIPYFLSQSVDVTITLYNTLGQKVDVLLDDYQTPGEHLLYFNEDRIPGGMYFYQMKINNTLITKKLLVQK